MFNVVRTVILSRSMISRLIRMSQVPAFGISTSSIRQVADRLWVFARDDGPWSGSESPTAVQLYKC